MQLFGCAARLLVSGAWGNGRTGKLKAGKDELQCKVSVKVGFEMGRFQVSEMWPWPPRSSHVPERGQTIRTSGQNLELWWMQAWAACFSAAERRERCSLRREEYVACKVSPCRRVQPHE
ncbi:hypothetical protein BDP81DRAFT_432822 [Colletotrichum phormii]|uniref:Uncharacterized protein n=1 Tax=Colletotrichum phormii TaxID=359342 RepID=A0AAI9ZPJ2_9PEZI|nr:uncharacterized protein BDP81DRAFT_432822 [Colletotrichum phormii]KAK1634439.1 hypothetical protein BDP81DRAFT_432822 [Colletotrichum phormii]